jgi:hypothetical protein
MCLKTLQSYIHERKLQNFGALKDSRRWGLGLWISTFKGSVSFVFNVIRNLHLKAAWSKDLSFFRIKPRYHKSEMWTV